MRKMTLFWGLLALLAMLPNRLLATTITYDVDLISGDTWQYSYMVSGSFDADYGFTILFAYDLYKDITPVSNSGDWNEITWPPAIILGSEEPGAYDALALIDGASLSDPFVVSFTWLGLGTPGSQLFSIYYDPFGPDFSADIETGQTQPANSPVPEPGTLLLVTTGLLGLQRVAKRHKK